MTISRGWRLLGASMCAAGLLLAGCGESGPGGGADDEDRSPLAEFFGWDDDFEVGGDREFSEEERQQHYQVQELIVTCMQDAGFEYHPEPFWGDDDRFGDMVDDPWQEAWELEQSDPEAYAKQYGYGVTTIDYDREPLPEDEWDPSDDPNWVYRESLSEPAQEAYDKALHGDWESFEEENGEFDDQEWDPVEIGGCWNEAYGEVHGWGGYGGEEDEWAQWEPLWEEWDRLETRIQDDPQLAEVMQLWSGCMAEAGHPGLETLWDGREEVYQRQEELYGWDEGEDGGVARATPSEEFDEDFDEDEQWEPVEPDPADLAALRDFELAIAWADYECRQEHDVDRIEREVRHEQEEQFIEDNRELLESYRDFINEQEGRG